MQPDCFALKKSKAEEGLVHDVINTSATHADLVHDVTDADCQAQNGHYHGRVYATFKRGFLK